MSMEGAALAQSRVSIKTANQKVLKIDTVSSEWSLDNSLDM